MTLTQFADVARSGSRRTSGRMNSRLCRRVLEYLNHVPQHRDSIAPRVLKVDGGMSLLGNDQRKALIEPPDRHTDSSRTYMLRKLRNLIYVSINIFITKPECLRRRMCPGPGPLHGSSSPFLDL